MTDTQTQSVIPISVIDSILTAQLAIAWAGEDGEEPRLGWWKTDLQSEFGGVDFFQRLLPNTWEWAVFQSTREAAQRTDAQLREQDHDADRLLSLFCFGFEIDERVDERLQDLKRAGKPPLEALPALQDVVSDTWEADQFTQWVDGHGTAKYTTVPAGRRLTGKPPSLELTVQHLVAGFQPLSDAYPLPHYRRPN